MDHATLGSLTLLLATCPPTRAQPQIPAEYPFHQKVDELVVTNGDQVLRTLPCQRIALDGAGRWGNDHVRGQLGRTSDGTLYAQVGGAYGAYWVVGQGRNVMFASSDEGRTWTRSDVDLAEGRIIGAFAVLGDDSFLAAATESTDERITFHRSADRGRTWEQVCALGPGPFRKVYLDGNLLVLRDGTVLAVLHYAVPAAEGEHFSLGLGVQYVQWSADGGRTWQGGPDPALWAPLIDAKLFIGPSGPEARIPGPGGTFPGCYETGLAEGHDGQVLAALRFSGPAWPWHQRLVKAWGGANADNVGRIFRQVMFSRSADAGRTWFAMQPFADADGNPVIVQQETNGQLLALPDGRLVLVHQRRFGPMQLIARVSPDGGKTWSPDEYRLSAGFGYSGDLLLDDGTIVTVTGQSLGGGHGAAVIRWRPSPP
jgi:hypothetical protein